MRITKFAHACVRVEHEGSVLVLDPGGFTDPEAVDGATAVLITHEHFDHYDAGNLRATDAPVYTIGAVAEQIAKDAPDVAERTTVVTPGQRFDVGVPVVAVGAEHAVIHPSYPTFANSGFRFDVGGVSVFHPGDSFTLPEVKVDVLLAPISGPWCKLGEVLDFVNEVAAARTLAIHERIFSEVGLGLADQQIAAYLDGVSDYHRVADGEDLPG